MNKIAALAAVLATLVVTPVVADETEGHVMAFDRVDGILVLTDKTVWQLESDIAVPQDLGRGDRVLLAFQSEGEEGVTKILGLDRLAIALPDGTDGGS